MAIDLGDLERWAAERGQAIRDTTSELIQRTTDDLRDTVGNIEECAKEVDKVRQRFTERAVEYTGRLSQELLSDVLERIQIAKQFVRERDPNPRVWMLKNPHRSVWQGAEPEFDELKKPFSGARVNDVAMVAFHGMDYNGGTSEAFNDYFMPMEKAFKFFKDSEQPKITTIVVTYDSRWSDEAERIASVLAWNTPYNYIMLAAIWDECERRATEAAKYALPFVQGCFETHDNVVGVSHSLGNYGWCELISRIPQDQKLKHPGGWISMEAAVPNTYLHTFPGNKRPFWRVPCFYGAECTSNSNDSGIVYLFHSNHDVVLSTAYFFARREMALGQFGGSGFEDGYKINIERRNTTEVTGLSHGVGNKIPGASGYFRKLAKYLDSDDTLRSSLSHMFR